MRLYPALCVGLICAVLCVSMMPSGETVGYRRYGNKIFYSAIDKNMVVVGPNDNRTLSMYSSYEMTFFRPVNSFNYSVRYNHTEIALKEKDIPAILFKIYVNDSIFVIDIVKEGNITPLIEIHYNAQGGFTDMPDWMSDFPQEHNEVSIIPPLSKDEVNLLIASIVMICPFVIVLNGYAVKRFKEHRTVGRDIGHPNESYRSNDNGEEKPTEKPKGSRRN